MLESNAVQAVSYIVRNGAQRFARAAFPSVLVAFLGHASVGCAPSDVVVAENGNGDEATSRGPRGRIVVGERTLLTDRGTRLRGVTITPDAGLDLELQEDPEAARASLRRYFDELALESGVNLVHVYLENQTTEPGGGRGFGDLLVEETERAGLYLLVALGSGTELGSFDGARAESFWNLYAPLYAERTHVFFELHNAPERNCNMPWAPASITLENELFALVRSHAPDTHVVAFSYIGTPTDAALLDGVTRTTIDWTNASVGFHATDECRPMEELATLPPIPADEPVALFATELPHDEGEWQLATAPLELGQLSWTSFRWLHFTSNMIAFRAQHDAIDVSWCPDFGTWPNDSATCSE